MAIKRYYYTDDNSKIHSIKCSDKKVGTALGTSGTAPATDVEQIKFPINKRKVGIHARHGIWFHPNTAGVAKTYAKIPCLTKPELDAFKAKADGANPATTVTINNVVWTLSRKVQEVRL